MPLIVIGLEKKNIRTPYNSSRFLKPYHGQVGVHRVELKVDLLVDSGFTLVMEQLPHFACHFSFLRSGLDVEDGLMLKRKVEVTHRLLLKA